MVDIVNEIKHVELAEANNCKPRKKSKGGSTDVGGSSSDQLRENIKQENDYIRCLVDSIPPTFYFTAEMLDTIDYNGHQDGCDKSNGQPRGGSKLPRKIKHKRDRLNREQSKTVTKILSELAKDQKPNTKKFTRPNVDGRPADVRLNNMDELKARLNAKLTKLRGVISLDEEDKRLKNRLKRRLSKNKLKERRKHGKALLTNGIGLENGSSVTPVAKTAEHTPAKPVFNQEGKMVFSKFDFSDGSGVRDSRKRGQFEGKNYKSLLTKVQQQTEKIKKLEVEGQSSRAIQLKEKLQWQAVLEKAEGLKVKNDPEKLQQAAKRKEKRKESSSKKWESRADHISSKKEARDKRRNSNLQTRKKDKIKNKIKKAVKRGRLVPGYS